MLTEIDPALPLSNIRTVDELMGASLASRRFIVALVGLFAAVALLLAMAGVYGVQAYAVAGQTSEIGVRVALGASHGEVLRRIVLRAMRPAVLGIAAGIQIPDATIKTALIGTGISLGVCILCIMRCIDESKLHHET